MVGSGSTPVTAETQPPTWDLTALKMAEFAKIKQPLYGSRGHIMRTWKCKRGLFCGWGSSPCVWVWDPRLPTSLGLYSGSVSVTMSYEGSDMTVYMS